MKLSRYLSTVAVALALVSCGGAEETPKEETDVVEDDSDTTIIVELDDEIEGIEPGSKEDYLQRVGEDAMVFFAFDKSELKPSAITSLKKQALWLKAYPDVEITIEGHCDERGTTEYNMGLGKKRANAVKNYLEAQGVDEDRMTTVSFGEERPLDPRHNEAAWARNRRSVSVIVE